MNNRFPDIKYRLFIVLMMLWLPSTVRAGEIDPDSLSSIREQFNDCMRDAQRLSVRIVTPDDYKNYQIDLERLEDRMKRLRDTYSDLLYTDKRIESADINYMELMKRIEGNVAEYRNQYLKDSMRTKMEEWRGTFDSLLTMGGGYAERKEADSVRTVKRRATELWGEVNGMRSANMDCFKSSDELETMYGELGNVQGKIQELSEKEKVKLRDILLVSGVIVGVLTMVIGTVGSRIREKKMRKKADEMPPLDL